MREDIRQRYSDKSYVDISKSLLINDYDIYEKGRIYEANGEKMTPLYSRNERI